MGGSTLVKKKRKGKNGAGLPEVPPELIEKYFPGGFTLRDEANALTAFAFRNGPLEDLHAGRSSPLLDDPSLSRITDGEMKQLMITASESLATMLALRDTDPQKYRSFVIGYNILYCSCWER
jgi:hypothetical protein